jgi:hypothetical protein
MAATNKYVDANLATGSHDGSDWTNAYASLSLAEAGLQKDLDTANEQMTIWCRSTDDSADTTAVDIDGWTTSVDDYLTIQAADGDQAIASSYSTSRYRLEVTDTNAISINEDFLRIRGLQIKSIYSATASKGGIKWITVGASAVIHISGCRIVNPTAGAADYICISPNEGTCYIYNCIIQGGDERNIYVSTATVYIYNCTIYTGAWSGIEQASGTVTVKNTAIFNTADDFSGTITCDYCASDDANATTYTNGQDFTAEATDWDAIWNDRAAGDFTLKNYTTAPCCVGKGTDLTATGLPDITSDIDSRSRVGVTWDIGAYQYTLGGSSGGLWALIAP